MSYLSYNIKMYNNIYLMNIYNEKKQKKDIYIYIFKNEKS